MHKAGNAVAELCRSSAYLLSGCQAQATRLSKKALNMHLAACNNVVESPRPGGFVLRARGDPELDAGGAAHVAIHMHAVCLDAQMHSRCPLHQDERLRVEACQHWVALRAPASQCAVFPQLLQYACKAPDSQLAIVA